MEGEQEQGKGSIISLEFIVGLIAIALGAYNLLSMFGVITYDITLPQATANTILIIAGLFLWLTAYRLWRHKYYSRRIFH